MICRFGRTVGARLLAAALAAVMACRQHDDDRPLSQMRDCLFEPWSAPAVVDPDDSGRVARFPRLALGDGAGFVIGTNIQRFNEEPVPSGPLVAWRLQGGAIGRPPGAFTFLFPRGAVDSRGRLHLFWAEPEEQQPERRARRWVSQRPSLLYAATFADADGWSAPRVLERADRLLWAPRGGWELGSASSLQHVVVPNANGRTPDIVYYALVDGEWIRRVVTLHGPPSYVSMTGAGRLLFVAYTAADRSWSRSPNNPTRSDVNSVFLMSSEDSGEHWSAPHLISQSGNLPAYHLQALLGAGKLHLIWKQSAMPGPTVRHVWSSDNGTTWSAPNDLNPRAPFEGLRAALDRCGNVHVIYEDWQKGPEGIHLDYAMLTDKWSAPLHLFDGMFAITPDLRVNSDGSPVLAFVGEQRGHSIPERYVTLLSFLKLRR